MGQAADGTLGPFLEKALEKSDAFAAIRTPQGERPPKPERKAGACMNLKQRGNGICRDRTSTL